MTKSYLHKHVDMKQTALNLLILFALLTIENVSAQAPKLYVHIVSHNEPTDNLDASAINYNRAKTNVLQMATIVDSKNAKWNLQTSDGFVLGALQYDTAGTRPNDVFELLANAPYNDNIEIDPRSKNKNGRNIADQWYLLDSCGANPSHHLGGCIYSTTNPGVQPIDWLQYWNPIIGNIYGNSWQCSLITGAGSYPPHSNDLHDFGVFKPDTTTNFYAHNAARNLWCMGTGCAPLLDSLDDEQAIIDLIQAEIDSIQNGLWPANKFYVTRIMTNQREYGPMFFQKIAKVIDSLNVISPAQFQWATISETFTAFQSWQSSSSLEHSQWLCGQTLASQSSNVLSPTFSIYPNPFSNFVTIRFPDILFHTIALYDSQGHIVHTAKGFSNTTLELSHLHAGLYFLKTDGSYRTLIKE